jgi:gas vesicle protein
MYDARRGGSVFGAFLLGGLMGAVLGLLFAPRSGKETREMIAEKSGEYWGEAGEYYVAGKEKVTGAVTAGQQAASQKGEELRSKIDEARGRLQDQVARSASSAKDKIADTTPAVNAAVDKAADATKSGVEAASGKAQDSLEFVAKKAAGADDASMGTAGTAPAAGMPSPVAPPASEA